MKKLRYMLDSNVLMHLANRADGHENIMQKLLDVNPSTCCVSAIVAFELKRKILRGDGRKTERTALDALLAEFTVLPFDEEAANWSGYVASVLEISGTKIGNYDNLIAGHAMSAALILVTDNVREFERTGQPLENWRTRD